MPIEANVQVDFPARALSVAEAVEKLILSGRANLKDKEQQTAVNEIRDIVKNLSNSPADSGDHTDVAVRSVLPTKLLRARWARFRTDELGAGFCYPFFGSEESGDGRIDFAVDPPEHSKLPTGRRFDMEKSIVLSEGRFDSPYWESFFEMWTRQPNDPQFVLFTSSNDPLLELFGVFSARHEILFERFKKVLPHVGDRTYSPIMGQIQQNIAAEEKSKNEPLLLKEHLRMKAWFELYEDTPAQKGLTVRACPGLTTSDLHKAAHIQRLAVLILWLFYRDKLARVDQGRIDYLAVEGQMRKLGLSDEPPATLVASLERIEARFSTEELLVRQEEKGWTIWRTIPPPTGWKVWKSKSQTEIVLIPRLPCGDFDAFGEWLNEQVAEHGIHVPSAQFLVGPIDGSTARKLLNRIGIWWNQCPGEEKRVPLLIDVGAVAFLTYGLSSKRFDENIAKDCELEVRPSEDLLLSLGDGICVVDPQATLLWLATRNMAIVQAGEQEEDLSRYAPKRPPLPPEWMDDEPSEQPVVEARKRVDKLSKKTDDERIDKWKAQKQKNDERDQAALCHLLGLVIIPLGIGNVLCPYLYWRTWRKSSDFVDRHGCAAFNFQFTLSSIRVCGIILSLFAIYSPEGGLSGRAVERLRTVGVTCMVGLYIGSLVGIIRSYRAAKAGESSRYWFAIPFAKAGGSG